MRIVLALWLVAGCETSRGIDLSTPEGAARCQHAAIEAKRVDAWASCLHPKLRDDAKAELARRATEPGFWEQARKRAAPFATVTSADFTVSPSPPERTALGDQQASYRVSSDRDALEVVRSEGQWYVVDTGI